MSIESMLKTRSSRCNVARGSSDKQDANHLPRPTRIHQVSKCQRLQVMNMNKPGTECPIKRFKVEATPRTFVRASRYILSRFWSFFRMRLPEPSFLHPRHICDRVPVHLEIIVLDSPEWPNFSCQSRQDARQRQPVLRRKIVHENEVAV